jgi:hypothetical protein
MEVTGKSMARTRVDPVARARTIVHRCLERDFCKQTGAYAATDAVGLGEDFDRYRDGFQIDSPSHPFRRTRRDELPASVDRWAVLLFAMVILSMFLCSAALGYLASLI